MKPASSRIAEYLFRHYAADEFPALLHQAAVWRDTRPLDGIRILDATPVYRNTLAKYMALLAAGAELHVPPPSIMPGDEGILRLLPDFGVGVGCCDGDAYDIILDCAGSCADREPRVGFVELTRSGAYRFASCSKPVFLADAGRIKQIETCLGTGESFFRAMRQLGYSDFAGKKLVVFGYGKVGRGVVLHALHVGMQVVVVDVLDRSADVPDVASFVQLCKVDALQASLDDAWCIVTATGIRHALEGIVRPELLGEHALMANMGVEDEFGPSVPVERVLAAKRPLNFILDEPTSMCYIETTMALHNAGALELLNTAHDRGLFEPSEVLEDMLLAEVVRKGRIAAELSLLDL